MPGYNFFRPDPGRFGVMPVAITTKPVFGTLAAGTVSHQIGAYPFRCYINAITIVAKVFPDAATSVVATLQKKPSGSAIALTNGIDIDAKTADVAVAGTFITTLTDAQRTLNPGESLLLSVVTTGAVSVQPTDLMVIVELLVLE
jgi:hypothetical protein